MTSKMFLDIVGVITISKLSILSTFKGGAVSAPPCQVGLSSYLLVETNRKCTLVYCVMGLIFTN